jgi:hypothetical protein
MAKDLPQSEVRQKDRSAAHETLDKRRVSEWFRFNRDAHGSQRRF